MKKTIVIALICVFVVFITIFLSIQHDKNMQRIQKHNLSNVGKSESSTEVDNYYIAVGSEQYNNVSESKGTVSNNVDNNNRNFEDESLMSEKQFIYDVVDEMSYMGRSYLDKSILKKMYKVYVKLEGRMIPDDYNILYRYLELYDYSVEKAASVLKKDQEANGIYF